MVPQRKLKCSFQKMVRILEGGVCPEWALKVMTLRTSTPRTSSSLLMAIVLSTVQEADIISVVVPAEGATHCLLREIRPTELK